MEILHAQSQKEELSLRASFCIPHRSVSDFRYRAEHGGIAADLGTYVVDALLRAGLPMSRFRPSAEPIQTSCLSGQVDTVGQPQSHARWAIGAAYKNEFVVMGTSFQMDLQRVFSPPVDEPTSLTTTAGSGNERPVNHVFSPANATHLCIINALQAVKDRYGGIVDSDRLYERISILENNLGEGSAET